MLEGKCDFHDRRQTTSGFAMAQVRFHLLHSVNGVKKELG